MMKRRIEKHAMSALAALTIVGASGLALAQAAKTPAETIEYRQQSMKAMGQAFRAINTEARAPMPNVDTIRTNLPAVQKVAAELPTLFPAGTGPETGVKTAAKPEIWANRADFDQKVAAFQAAAKGLVTASAGSDGAAVTAAAGAVGQACGGCHTNYRVQPPRPAAPPPAAPAS
jgi:cytochrome c556